MEYNMNCPACGEEISGRASDGATFIVCPICGNEVAADYKAAYDDRDEDQ